MSENFSYIPTFKRINPYDYTVNKFKAYKTWTLNNNIYSSSYNKCHVYQALKPTDIFRNGIIPYSSSKYIPILNIEEPKTDKGILWNSLEHNYYKEYNKLYNISEKQKLQLYTSASYFSVATLTYGEGIKRNTLSITDNSSTSSISLTDDGYGNIIDTNINTSSFINSKYLELYLGFNEVVDKKHTTILNQSNQLIDISYEGNYIQNDGILSTGILSTSCGNSFLFNNDNHIKIKDNKDWFDLKTNSDYSISFWIKLPTSQSNDIGSIITKKREGYINTQDVKSKKYNLEYRDLNENIYPINLNIYGNGSNNGKLIFNNSDGVNNSLLTSSISINDNNFHHIALIKSGSNIKLYIDNVLNVTGSSKTYFNVGNNCDWFIGSDGANRNNLSGSIDELRFYNKGLNSQEVFNLYNNDFETGSAFQSNRVGNIFYKTGDIIISDYRKRYQRVFLGETGSQNYNNNSGFDISFKSTQTIYEHEILCKIKPSEFNTTLNPSARIDNSLTSMNAKPFTTGSSFTPYITTIGLYNNNYQLVAIAKLASPIPKRDDVPLNFIVRFDT
jgi:hypothetical protein